MLSYLLLASIYYLINIKAIFVFAIATEHCPNATYIDPCYCVPNAFYSLRCELMDSHDILERTFQGASGSPINSIKLMDSTLPSFPLGILRHLPIEFLYFKNITFQRLFDSSQNFTNSVRHLIIRNSTIMTGWQWSQLASFSNLRTLVVYNTSVGERITESFSQQVNPAIKRVSLIGAGITHVSQNAFANQINMTYLKLTRNSIRTIESNLLPRSLRHLSVSLNKLRSLPIDTFRDTPHLVTVDLSHNGISSLSRDVYKYLWRNSTSIRLQGNPLKCDCSMKWITSTVSPLQLLAKCRHPKRLYGRDLRSLTEEDFDC